MNTLLPIFDGYEAPIPSYSGEIILLEEAHYGGRWFVQLTPEGVVVTEDGVTFHASITGRASDILLFMYGRTPSEHLAVTGDQQLAQSWEKPIGTF